MMRRDPPGGRVIGRYLLCDEIAAGGMATIHIGRQLGPVGFARTVAIKRLHAQFAKDPEFVEMFLDEARIAASVRHPNVVSTIDVVMLDGELFVAMEYVHAESLAKLVRTCRTRTGQGVPLAVAMSIVSGVLYGLHAAHEARDQRGAPLHIVHRDVSPQNVLVGLDGVPRVVDFGVAKATGRMQSTREGALKGKLFYMSPEQVMAEEVDRRTDVYAATVVLWEMLTGRRLFTGDGEMVVIKSVLTGAVDPPSAHAPGIPPEVDALVARGLSRDRTHRFATALEMAEAAQALAYATPGQVGAWVRELAGASLEGRAARVLAIEQSATPPPHAPSYPGDEVTTQVRVPPEPEAASHVGVFVAPPAARRSRAPVVLALAVPSVVLAVIVVALIRVVSSEPPPVAAASPAPSAEVPAASSAPAALSSSPPVASAPPPVEPKPAPRPVALPGRPRAPAPRPAAAPQPASKPGCAQPYTIDERGVRVPKMECL